MSNDTALQTVTENVMFSCFSVTNYADAQRVAMTLAASDMVPEQYRMKPGQDKRVIGNCLIALDMALRLRMSPLMVMQNMYNVHGRPSWSASFLVAAINQSGRFRTPLRYRIDGEGDDWGCVAWAIDHSGERVESTRITIGMAKAEGWTTKSGSKWKTMPEQMLRYRAATFFCRAYCPEIAMGMQTTDEVIDVIEPVNVNQNEQTMENETSKTASRAKEMFVKKQDTAPVETPDPEKEEASDTEPPSPFEVAKQRIENAEDIKALKEAHVWYTQFTSDGTGEIADDEWTILTELFTQKQAELKARK